MAKSKKQSEKNGTSIVRSIPKPQLNLASETKRGIAIVVFIILAGVTSLSVIGSAGTFGQIIFKMFTVLFGVIGYLVPILLMLIAWILFKGKPEQEESRHLYSRTYLGMLLIAGSVAGLIHALYITADETAISLANQGKAGGYLGALFAGPLVGAFGIYAGGLLLIGLLVIGILVAFNISPHKWFEKKETRTDAKLVKPELVKINSAEIEAAGDVRETIVVPQPRTPQLSKINNGANALDNNDAEAIKMEAIKLEDRRDWKLPPFDLLDENKTKVNSGDIESKVALIQKTLADFGITVEMGEVNVGPTVTQYTFIPAPGVKLAQISSLQNNLALALAAQSLRMELPIPGKALVGIEVPNVNPATVTLREVMQTSDFVNSTNKLTVALGRDVAGKPMVVDLAKMPHMLIAGTTGSGKSVAINSLIISLLYRNTPQDVKLIMVDPKQVELTPYNGIPHLLTPAITDPEKAVNALKWAVAEMQKRYKLVADAGKRNIIDYNEGSELKMPYIVIIVDELANLMTLSKQDVEAAISQLASLARAVGIHLVLATQRPSTEVVTGLIKANISTRAAFKLPSQIDSRTILDSAGAEKLLGLGDMLFVTSDSSKPRRIQGTFVGSKEVHKVVDFFKAQAGAVIYSDEIIEKPKRGGIPGLEGAGSDGDDDGGDDLYGAAKEEVIRAKKASASLLQRRLRVGYARAARLLDILEENGVIGPGDGAKPREVYGVVPDEEQAEYGIDPEDNRQNF